MGKTLETKMQKEVYEYFSPLIMPAVSGGIVRDKEHYRAIREKIDDFFKNNGKMLGVFSWNKNPEYHKGYDTYVSIYHMDGVTVLVRGEVDEDWSITFGGSINISLDSEDSSLVWRLAERLKEEKLAF